MEVFESADVYIECGTSIKDKIDRIDAIIDTLLSTAVKSAVKDGVSEYTLNNGQTTIKTVLKGTDSIAASIQAYNKLKQIFIQQLNNNSVGRVVRLVDSKNFNRGGGY